MAVGEFPEGGSRDLDSLYFPRGIILDRDLSQVHPYDHELVREYITHSWYEYPEGDAQGLHPWEGETQARYTGPAPPWEYLHWRWPHSRSAAAALGQHLSRVIAKTLVR